jgi:penicillin-binding protein 1A
MLGGDRAKPWGIRRVIGPDGEVIKEYAPEITRNVLDPRVCAEMDRFLRGVVTGGTATRAAGVPNARGKTGTTSDHRDAWFCGYTNSLVGIGWVASERKEDGRWVYDPMNRVYGGRVTIEIWTGVMKEAVKRYAHSEEARVRSDLKDLRLEPPDEPPVDDVAGGTQPFPETVPPIDGPPTGDGASSEGAGRTPVEGGAPPSAESGAPAAVTVEICADSGVRATAYCPETVTRRYIRGEEPKRKCPIHGP